MEAYQHSKAIHKAGCPQIVEDLDLMEAYSTDRLTKTYTTTRNELLANLSAHTAFTQRLSLASTYLTIVGKGSGRITYDFDESLVLKVARNTRGMAQNSVESQHTLQEWHGGIIAKVVDCDPNNQWLIMEKAEKFKPSDFSRNFGVTGWDLENYIGSILGHWRYCSPVENPALQDNKFAQELLTMFGNFGLLPGELHRPSSWGKIQGNPVIVDYGLTQDVYDQHYYRR